MAEHAIELDKFRKKVWEFTKKTLKANDALDLSDLVDVLDSIVIDVRASQVRAEADE